jgi:hypothetical protein
MAEGVNAVKLAILWDFRPAEVCERHNFETKDTILKFVSENRPFAVEVTHEFDSDYANSEPKLDLRGLAATLRESASGSVIVMNSGIRLKLDRTSTADKDA